jgi:hypothetical protein
MLLEGLPVRVRSEIDKRVALGLVDKISSMAVTPSLDQSEGSVYLPTEYMRGEVVLVATRVGEVIKSLEIDACRNCGKCEKIASDLEPTAEVERVLDPKIKENIQANEASVNSFDAFKQLVTGTRKITPEMAHEIENLLDLMNISEVELTTIALLRRRTRDNSAIVDELISFIFQDRADTPLRKHMVSVLETKFNKKDLQGIGAEVFLAKMTNPDGQPALDFLAPWRSHKEEA